MHRRTVQIVLIAGSVLSVVGCAYSITGGLIGGLVTAVVTGLLLLGTTTTSCSSVSTCLSIAPDTDIGPCLEPFPPDVIESDIGPCLGAPLPDAGEPDAMEPDIEPCLSQLPPDAEAPEDSASASPRSPVLAKAAIQKKLIDSGALPSDIAKKLTDDDTDATS
jgi:hypothetical protein